MNTCSVTDCGRKIHARGWCNSHYKTWWLTLKPQEKRKAIHRVNFSVNLWDRWMRERLEEHPHHTHLAQGISAFRERLNS